MVDEQTYLLDANTPAEQMLGSIAEAGAADDPDTMREHIQQALDDGQNYAEDLDQALTAAEDPDVSDRIEEAMHHLDMALEHGEAAIDAPDEDIRDYLSAMLTHARQSYASLQEAVGARVE